MTYVELIKNYFLSLSLYDAALGSVVFLLGFFFSMIIWSRFKEKYQRSLAQLKDKQAELDRALQQLKESQDLCVQQDRALDDMQENIDDLRAENRLLKSKIGASTPDYTNPAQSTIFPSGSLDSQKS